MSFPFPVDFSNSHGRKKHTAISAPWDSQGIPIRIPTHVHTSIANLHDLKTVPVNTEAHSTRCAEKVTTPKLLIFKSKYIKFYTQVTHSFSRRSGTFYCIIYRTDKITTT